MGYLKVLKSTGSSRGHRWGTHGNLSRLSDVYWPWLSGCGLWGGGGGGGRESHLFTVSVPKGQDPGSLPYKGRTCFHCKDLWGG